MGGRFRRRKRKKKMKDEEEEKKNCQYTVQKKRKLEKKNVHFTGYL